MGVKGTAVHAGRDLQFLHRVHVVIFLFGLSGNVRGVECHVQKKGSFFTGSLFWFGDDGTTDSSILIRTLEMRRGRAWLGAGGGIVADSDPEEEWRESNHKAEALATALGFSPEEAR